jgi:hypothetical protein
MAERSTDIKTPLARLAYPNLLKPQKMEDGKEKYNCTLLFPKSADLKVLKDAVLETAERAWPGKARDMLKNGLIKNPFLDGDGPQGLSKKSGARHAGFEGTQFIRCSSTIKPKLVNRKVEPVISEDEIYPGCYAYAVINAFTWEDPRNGRGVSFGISMLQVAKDGERLGGGGGDPSQHFEAIPDDGQAASGDSMDDPFA